MDNYSHEFVIEYMPKMKLWRCVIDDDYAHKGYGERPSDAMEAAIFYCNHWINEVDKIEESPDVTQ